jgi:chemotaxis protein MotB
VKRPSPTVWIPWAALVLVLIGSALWIRSGREAAALARSSAREANAQTKTLREDLARKARESEATAASVERLQRENEELIAIKTELQSSVEAQAEELERLTATKQRLEQRMAKEISAGDIRLTQVGGKLQVGLVDKILFSSGEAEVSPAGKEVLKRIGEVLAGIENRQVLVSGHTDDQPPGAKLRKIWPTNWELSVARATHVVRFLEEEAKVPGKRLAASGYGPNRPVASNATPRGRARNRRIEILLTPVIQGVSTEGGR